MSLLKRLLTEAEYTAIAPKQPIKINMNIWQKFKKWLSNTKSFTAVQSSTTSSSEATVANTLPQHVLLASSEKPAKKAAAKKKKATTAKKATK